MSLHVPSRKRFGRLLPHAETGQAAVVLLAEDHPAARPLFLRFALVLRGTGRHFIPSFLLDDWGKENRKLSLYEWIYKNGDMFPRAELFGYYLNPEIGWEAEQCFVRDLELMARWPLYVVLERHAPIEDSRRIKFVCVENKTVQHPNQISRPDTSRMPLLRSDAFWWEIPPDYSDAAFI